MAQSITSTPRYAARVKAEVEQRSAVRVIDLVSLLEWTYATQRAHMDILNQDEARHLGSRCSMPGLEQYLTLGTFVDGGGRSHVDLHPDAEAVHSTVMRFALQSEDCAFAAGLLIHYASTQTQPEKPAVAGQKLEVRYDRAGRIAMSYWRENEELFVRPGTKLPKPVGYDGPGCRAGQACDLKVVTVESDLEAFLLETYTYWCAALEIIAEALPLLKTHKLKYFQAPVFDRRSLKLNYLESAA
ncbi:MULTISPECIES: hypothetical protein [unclassified Pseudovibrio]|uniref:hypothetical protein n=1 Tax=unclassified Pseudovibrio TaxID=2627060 RepID=UPI0007AEBE0D|nr:MULTISPECIES: hypothetical protein [unclassified Pseudovibrio]KZL02280.1 hypothetical protein PsW74_01378 [Pseudovibrio sp. W74]KZL08176.1 hypothetical protein PsAD14_03323 [Pseudovibrio sp. Ad14]